ncbi:MAG: hypothetical protein ACRC46_08490 [Thermoguttaceae bacterium]
MEKQTLIHTIGVATLTVLAVTVLVSTMVLAQPFTPPATSSTGSMPTTSPPATFPGYESSDREIEDRVRLFFSNLTAGSPTAFDDLLKGGPLGASLDAAKLAELKSQFEAAKPQLGVYRSNERIDLKPIGKDLVVARYLYKGEFSPMVWYFTFYRAPTTGATATTSLWFVISLRFDTNIEAVAMSL